MRSYALLAISFLAATIVPTSAQQPAKDGVPGSRYVPFPFERDVRGTVNDQLAAMKQLQKYKDVLAKLMRDPDKFQLNPDTLKKLNLNDPKLRKTLEPWVKKQGNGDALSLPELKKLQAQMQQLAKDSAVEDRAPEVGAPEPPPVEPPAANDREETARDWLKNAMERAEDSKLGNWLRDSPAWQKAILDLKASSRPSAAQSDSWGLDRLFGRRLTLDRLPTPDAKVLERFGKLRPPDLSRWTPSLPRPSLPNIGAPSLPSASSLGTFAMWLLGVGLIVLFAGQISRWTRLGVGRERSSTGLGPWPVDPAQVATRAELVRAFDYLALLVLGSPARTWHHRAVAQALAERDASIADIAHQLAALYEEARYTDGVDALPDDQRDRARLALAQLAGIPCR
jgi:hypothetical protein